MKRRNDMTRKPSLFVVQADAQTRSITAALARAGRWRLERFDHAEHFAERYDPTRRGCVLAPLHAAPRDPLAALCAVDGAPPVVMVAGPGDTAAAVDALKRGAFDVLPRPLRTQRVERTVRQAIQCDIEHRRVTRVVAGLLRRASRLSPLEREALGFGGALALRCCWLARCAADRPQAADGDTSPPPAAATGPLAATAAALSPRLRQTLRCLLRGEGEKQIAERLGLSRHTVHDYIKSLHRCFGVNSRGELLAVCLGGGLTLDDGAASGGRARPAPDTTISREQVSTRHADSVTFQPAR
jgi:FixJ family two-component response regulator